MALKCVAVFQTVITSVVINALPIVIVLFGKSLTRVQLVPAFPSVLHCGPSLSMMHRLTSPGISVVLYAVKCSCKYFCIIISIYVERLNEVLRASVVWICWYCTEVMLVSSSAVCVGVDTVSGATEGVNSLWESTGTSGLPVIPSSKCVVTLASCGSSRVKWSCDFNISEKQLKQLEVLNNWQSNTNSFERSEVFSWSCAIWDFREKNTSKWLRNFLMRH